MKIGHRMHRKTLLRPILSRIGNNDFIQTFADYICNYFALSKQIAA